MSEVEKEDMEKAHRTDWESNQNGCRQSFSSFKSYSCYRQADEAGLVRTTGSKPATTTKLSEADAKAHATKEWAANTGGIRTKFSSEKAYIGFRSAELRGHVR